MLASEFERERAPPPTVSSSAEGSIASGPCSNVAPAVWGRGDEGVTEAKGNGMETEMGCKLGSVATAVSGNSDSNLEIRDWRA